MKSPLHLLSALLLTISRIYAGFDATPRYAEGELLVKWKDGPVSYAASVGNSQIGSTVKRNFNALGWQLVALPQGMSVREGMEAYQQLGTVLAVEPDEIIEPIAPPVRRADAAGRPRPGIGKHGPERPVVPSDPMFGQQWYLNKIGATNAWNITTGSSNVVVAIIDTGVDYTHPDLAANMWRNPGETGLDDQGRDKATNGIDDDNNGYVDDVHGANIVDGSGDPMDLGIYDPPGQPDPFYHGTFCAGIIGAVGNNGEGIAGLNWSVRIMAIRFLPNDRSRPEFVAAAFSDLLAALDYVLEMKRRGVNIRVTSNSIGGDVESAAMRDGYAALGNEGILNVCAAFNSAIDQDLFTILPGGFNLPSVINVAASTESDALADFSNYGRSTVDLAAPGVNIASTSKGTNYATGDGTSFACPLVAGTAALLLAVNPNLTVDELKSALFGSVDQPAGLRGKVATNGRLNVSRALEYLTNANPAAIVIAALPAGKRMATNPPIQVTFNRPMNHPSVESAFVITPPISGTFEWTDDSRTFSFRHEAPFDPTTSYTVRILGTAQDAVGGTLDGNFNRSREGSPADDFLWTFRFPIPNDDFVNAQLLAGASGAVTGNNRYAYDELDEPRTFFGDWRLYGSSLWYRWTAPELGGWITFDLTSGTGFDSLLIIYTGDRLDRLVAVAGNDNYGSRTSSRVSFSAVGGTNYSVVVASKEDFDPTIAGPFKLSWYPTPPPGFTGTQMSPTSGVPGTKVSLTGTNFTGATGVLFNGSAASFTNAPSTNLDLRIAAVVPPDATSGSITILTTHGNVTSTTIFQLLPTPLAIRPTGANKLDIAWTATSPEFVLEQSENLSAGPWTPVTELPLRANGQSELTVAAPTGIRFYRLRKN